MIKPGHFFHSFITLWPYNNFTRKNIVKTRFHSFPV